MISFCLRAPRYGLTTAEEELVSVEWWNEWRMMRAVIMKNCRWTGKSTGTEKLLYITDLLHSVLKWSTTTVIRRYILPYCGQLQTTPQDPSVQTVLTWCHQLLWIYRFYDAIQMLLLLLSPWHQMHSTNTENDRPNTTRLTFNNPAIWHAETHQISNVFNNSHTN